MRNLTQNIQISIDKIKLEASLAIPDKATNIVVFVHGSGSSRKSPRNVYVAELLQQDGFATLLFDLLTEEEDLNYANRFDISLLTERLKQVTAWIKKNTTTKNFKIGYFGASTGAAAAIMAAADIGQDIKAVVSRGGRPDLANEALVKIKSPTLLIVGDEDYGVIELNEAAYAQINAPKAMEIIPGATHLFEEPGTLDAAAQKAKAWFVKYLR